VAYWEIVTRSFRIAWRFKYLWLLALFAGEGGGGFNFNFNYSLGQPPGSRNPFPNPSTVQRQASDWLGQHIALVAAVAILFLVVAIAFFVLAAVCEGAVVRAAAEHDADRPFSLGPAWRCGVSTMGSIIRLRLLLIALYLPAFILLVAILVGFVLALVNQSAGAAVALGALELLLFLVAIPYAIYLSFLDRLGTRAVVLELLKARAALARAHRLLVKRLGRVLLVWLLSIAVGLALAVCTGLVLAVLSVPAVIGGIAAYASGSSAFWLVVAVAVLILVPVALIISGFIAAQASTYWTLAFRRLEIDQAPWPGSPYPQPAPGQGAG
jgi:hypothetical protein